MTEAEINLYMKDIVDTMNDGLFLIRPDGTISMVNDALTRILGYSREELLNQSCMLLDCDVCEKSRAQGRKHWCRVFHTGRESKKSCHIRRKDGGYVHVLKNASILKDDDGTILGSVETITDISELDAKEQQIRQLSRILEADSDFHGMVGRSPAMRRVYDLLERMAQSEAPVIIFGESGTGKELAARAIHELGPRQDGPFVQINCAALNESLLESEIFGHAKGAFTGAYRHRTGRFEEAGGGDIFLDEIGDVPLGIQVKLLRVLETKTFERVGENRPLSMDARIITATNQDLRRLVAEGRFREDFFFRINVIPIHLPPLRERPEDLPLLIEHFLKALAQSGHAVRALSPAAMELAAAHPWPGNVRELRSALEYAAVVCPGEVVEPEHLPAHLAARDAACPAPPPAAPGSPTAETQAPLPGGPEEKRELIRALRQTGGNKSAAARLLGINRVTVLNRMRKYGVDCTPVITG